MRRMGASLISLCALSAATTASAQDAAVITTDLNMRAGPSSRFPVITTLPADVRVEIYGCVDGYEWCDVSWRGNRGWVFADYLNYRYDGRLVPVVDYGPRIGIDVVGFSVDSYWQSHYRDRPWYDDRSRWITIWDRDGRDYRGRDRRDVRDRDWDRDRDRDPIVTGTEIVIGNAPIVTATEIVIGTALIGTVTGTATVIAQTATAAAIRTATARIAIVTVIGTAIAPTMSASGAVVIATTTTSAAIKVVRASKARRAAATTATARPAATAAATRAPKAVSAVRAALLGATSNAPRLVLPAAAIRRLRAVHRAKLEAVQAPAVQGPRVAVHPARPN